MMKTTRAGSSAPAHSIPLPSPDHRTADRRATALLVGVLGSLGGAGLLAAGACAFALGSPAPLGFSEAAAIIGALAGAAALGGIGLTLALRERRLHAQALRRTSRAEHIQHELDSLGLTPREMTVARFILQHRSYDDIAERCQLSTRTVQFHASNIFHKAYVTRRRDFERIMLAEPVATVHDPFERIPRLYPVATGGTALPRCGPDSVAPSPAIWQPSGAVLTTASPAAGHPAVAVAVAPSPVTRLSASPAPHSGQGSARTVTPTTVRSRVALHQSR